MKRFCFVLCMGLASLVSSAQEVSSGTAAATAGPTLITLEDAIRIALSENTSIKVADKEVERVGYARKGTYASLFPQIDASGTFQRTIKKQVMYMDSDSGGGGGFASMITGALMPYLTQLYAQHPGLVPPVIEPEQGQSSSDGISVGRWNTWSGGITASMPLVNAQLWKNLKISGEEVDLAVEKARSSRLETVNQVKQMYYTVLLAKDALDVYKEVYENALDNLEQTQMKYNAQKASELDLTRAKTNLANAVPNMYDAESSVILSLWQLKAVMGVSLDENIDVSGRLADYGEKMLYNTSDAALSDLEHNSTMRQLAIQAEELANMIKVQKAAYIPSLSLAFNYSMNAMTNDFNFSEYKWTPYSYVGVSLQIPIFSGGRRLNQVRQAKVQSTELELQRINTERQLKISIRQNLNLMDTATKSMSSARSAVQTAQKAYDIARKSYNVGRSTLTDLNSAQLALTQAQLTVSQAIHSFLSAKANLENVLGTDID